MPRPVKCRKVCHFPNVLEFFPADDTEKKTPEGFGYDPIFRPEGYDKTFAELGHEIKNINEDTSTFNGDHYLNRALFS